MSKYFSDFRRGDTVSKTITVTGIDITGYIFTFTMKHDLEDSTPALKVVHVAGAGDRDDPVNGVV